MGRLGWLPAAVLAAVTAMALSVCAWAYSLRGRDEAAIAAVILLLLFVQIVLSAWRERGLERDIDELFLLAGEDGPLARRLDDLEQRLFGEEPDEPSGPPALRARERLAAEIKDLRSSLDEISRRAAAAGEPRAPARERPRQSGLVQERLDLYLEPVLSLRSRAVLHQRASLGIDTGRGRRLEHAALYAEAERGGLRAALDIFALQRILPVARRLTAARPGSRVFLPIGAATLTRPSYVAEIERLIGEAPQVAQGLVFEIAQEVLAALDEAGIKGLARLARQGPLLCLGAAEARGLDLAALKGLRFRYLCFAAGGFPEDGLGLARLAVVQGFEIIAADVATAEEAALASQWAGLGRGEALAPPRLVKPEPADQAARAA